MGDTTEPRTSERPSGIIAGVKLEDLQATAAVRGILSDALVTVVSARWFGADALELTCRGAGGELGSEILYRDDEARLEMVEQGRPWSFDGDGELFRLVSRGAAHPPRAPVRLHAGGAHLAGGAAAASDHRGVRGAAAAAAVALPVGRRSRRPARRS